MSIVISASPPVRWNLPWPDSSKPAAGYRVLQQAEHFEIYHATPETGVYSHHSQITHHQGAFLAAWSNHPTPEEDAPGQRVLGAVSADGERWSDLLEVFPPMDRVESKDTRPPGPWRVLTPAGWAIVDDTAYAIAEVTDSAGAGPDEPPAARSAGGRYPGRRGWGRVAREVRPDGAMGEIFWLVDDPPEPMAGCPPVSYTHLTLPTNREV